jgi:hypothetical protein
MSDNLTVYVNSTMDEFHEYGAELYEAMMDKDQAAVTETIKKINKSLADVRKSFQEDEF